MTKEYKEIPQDAWIPVGQLAKAEYARKREIYDAVDAGMIHARLSVRRIRVRRADWRAWVGQHVRGGAQEPGSY